MGRATTWIYFSFFFVFVRFFDVGPYMFPPKKWIGGLLGVVLVNLSFSWIFFISTKPLRHANLRCHQRLSGRVDSAEPKDIICLLAK